MAPNAQDGPDMQAIEAEIRGFLAECVLAKAEVESLTADTPLIDSGILNSLTLTELVVYLEQRYDLVVTPAEYSRDNFQTMQTICEFVRRKLDPAKSNEP